MRWRNTNLLGSCSLNGGVRGNNGSPRLIPWLPTGVVVTSLSIASSWLMKVGYPEAEQEEVTETSLLASDKGGETGTDWNMPVVY